MCGSEANTRGFESYFEVLRIGVLGHSSSGVEAVGGGRGFVLPHPLSSCLHARQKLGDGRPRVMGVEVSAGL